jgi:CheY-like chemotaxis protein
MDIDLRPILLAEDDPRDMELTLQALRDHHLANRVVVARDGVETLKYLRESAKAGSVPGLPAVLLLDIKMPRLTGLDVLAQIRSDPDLKNLPVVMLTSSREGPDLQAAYDLGANAYVVKPVGFNEFIDAVRQVGAFWALLNEPAPMGQQR